jgi:hypothetical protein
MGVMYDYFRAPSVAAVQEQMVLLDGGPLVREGSESSPFDGVELKLVDQAVALARLIGFVTDEPLTTGLVNDRLIWPEGGEQDTEYMGPWVALLTGRSRDVLAGIPAQRIPEFAQRWAGIEEFSGFAPADFLASVVESLGALARRACDAGESLYCWISL